jgi:hypothetical protein
MNYPKIPFDAKDFGISWAGEVPLEQLCDYSTGTSSPSDADKSEPIKFNAHFGAQVAPLLPTEVQNVFLPAASSPTTEVFAANFLLGFKALARASS